MTHAPYIWRADGSPAKIKQHSVAKHEILRTYLVEYIQTLVISPHQEELKLTLVDGFAGGGMYEHEDTKVLLPGSPLIFLEAATEAEALINRERQKPLRMNLDYFFVEKKKAVHQQLLHTLTCRGYGVRVGRDIRVLHGEFDDHVNTIRAFINAKSPKNGRSIFLLDQYGYSKVPAAIIRTILAELPRAEIILTFNVDAFINFANDAHTNKLLQQIGVPDVLRGRTIDDIKRNEKDFRLYIQSCLYKGLVDACGARYYTPFFVRNPEGHGDYWLVHLSQVPRARDVMTRIHWKKNNNFIHYGGAGLNMFQVLGYSSERDSAYTGQASLGFCFDDPAKDASVKALMEQLPHIVYAHQDGVSFGELFATTCNTSPADADKYKEALAGIASQKDIEIVGPDGARRLKASTITDKDQLVPSRQHGFAFD